MCDICCGVTDVKSWFLQEKQREKWIEKAMPKMTKHLLTLKL